MTVAYTCIAAVILPHPLLWFSLGFSPLLLFVQILPLLFGMTQAEHQAMKLEVKIRQLKKQIAYEPLDFN